MTDWLSHILHRTSQPAFAHSKAWYVMSQKNFVSPDGFDGLDIAPSAKLGEDGAGGASCGRWTSSQDFWRFFSKFEDQVTERFLGSSVVLKKPSPRTGGVPGAEASSWLSQSGCRIALAGSISFWENHGLASGFNGLVILCSKFGTEHCGCTAWA